MFQTTKNKHTSLIWLYNDFADIKFKSHTPRIKDKTLSTYKQDHEPVWHSNNEKMKCKVFKCWKLYHIEQKLIRLKKKNK